jgi:hypothetical protein
MLAVLLLGACCLLPASRAFAQDAALQRDINQAIDRGVAYLKQIQNKDGRWQPPAYSAGTTALAVWTLLESGVSPDDPAVQKGIRALREDAIPLVHNYSAALAIMCLDRLDDPADEALIESLAFRIMASQTRDGGWGYTLTAPPASEIERLTLIRKRIEDTQGKREPRKAPRKPGDATQLAPEIRLQLTRLFREGLHEVVGDNSNTQFAMLALWVARRHGMPVDASLALVEARFRQSQYPIGIWTYFLGNQATIDEKTLREPFGSIQSMTCAGLLGLAVGHPTTDKPKAPKKLPRKDLTKDLQIKAGLAAVGAFIGAPFEDRSKVPTIGGKAYYSLWTLERMGVVYGLKTIANKDWYTWGAQLLVANQKPDGSWHGEYGLGGCDTCFALLFLKRANVAPDLTANLQGKVKDPGSASPQLMMMIGKEPGAASVGSTEPNANPREAPASAVVGRLSSQLVEAAGPQQEALMQKLRNTPGTTYTEALAGAIPKLRGTVKTRARQALTQRFEAMEVSVLRDQMRATDLEIRRAAAAASAAKKARVLVPDLIQLLEDSEAAVTQAAHASLRQLTSQDFGPELDASRAERAAAVDAWRKWWKQQSP